MPQSRKKLIEYSFKKLFLSPIKTPADLEKMKREIAKECRIRCPRNVELLRVYHKLLKDKSLKEKSENLKNIFKKRPIRSLSGVVVITVLTKPYRCPGKCIYCPKEKNFPKSYLSGEPAAQRAKDLNFNPYLQVKKRLESLEAQGHPTDKIELIVLGGSFTFYPKKFQRDFILQCFLACNRKNGKYSKNTSLEKEQKKNETAKHRIVGLTIETRPDLINEKKVVWLRSLGATKIEIGVQSTNEEILKTVKRNHSLKDVKRATKILKDAGFKITYHLMANLPGANQNKDFQSFKKTFSDPDLRPDWLKIYPCVVCKGSKLYKIWKNGKYKPYTNEQLTNLLIKIKSKTLPYWVRVGRLFRDIPAQKIEAGCKTSNLREIIHAEMKKRKLICKCIRCREVKNNYNSKEKIILFREDYKASKGKEIFLSFENKERSKLFAFIRIRIPSEEKHHIPALDNSAIIRELHTYGQVLPLKERGLFPQHQGLGKRLIAKAEEIVKKEFSFKKIAVISGIGVRNYYKKLGYTEKDTYMTKEI